MEYHIICIVYICMAVVLISESKYFGLLSTIDLGPWNLLRRAVQVSLPKTIAATPSTELKNLSNLYIMMNSNALES